MDIKIGQKVWWRGSWGRDPEQIALVTGIEVGCIDKQGHRVDQVTDVEQYPKESIIIVLDNRHWAYGYQIRPVDGQPLMDSDGQLLFSFMGEVA